MILDFNNIPFLETSGFRGFITIKELQNNTSVIPKSMGVYLVLYKGKEKPEFANTGTGGHFKGRNPNVSVKELNDHWVGNTKVIYIGKAGGKGSSATLQSRLKQYLKFGQGRNIGHWGGRLIWQIKNAEELIICWIPLHSEEPRNLEHELIQQFKTNYGKRPFANLSD